MLEVTLHPLFTSICWPYACVHEHGRRMTGDLQPLHTGV
jgi:hypothetical protein